MKVEDFERARREGMEFEGVHLLNSEVLSVNGSVAARSGNLLGVWDSTGKFYAFMQQSGNDDTNLVIVHTAAGVYASWNGRTLIRTPWFDLKFE